MPETELLTYSEWNAKGRRIHKGRKARGFRNKEALFALEDTYIPGAAQKVSAYLGITGPWDDPPH